MPAILVIGGLIALFLLVKHGGGSGTSVAAGSGFSRVGGGGALPDPGATYNNAGMVGSAAHTVPQPNQITPFAGTAKLAPDQALALLNGSNRIAALGVGQPKRTLRVPPSPSVRTSNPATTPFGAVATNPISGSQAFNPGRSVQTVLNGSGRKI